MRAGWVSLGNLEDLYGPPIVVLDQNVAANGLADELSKAGLRVAKPPANYAVPDREIVGEADRLGALILTRDRGPDFRVHPRALMLPKKLNVSDDNYGLVVGSVRFAVGLADSLPDSPYTKPNSVYAAALHRIRDDFVREQV
ncbi:MAG: hypothetical protein HYS53_02350 [Candidatus Aenigmarchaeota archaeon]|nr:hypothetical protein [Candidatus Aenigmarchaeota archaeon]